MNNQKIDQILKLYWEGETSLDDEKLLKAYFASDEVKEEHKSLQPLFGFFSSESELSLSHFDEEELVSKISQAKVVNFRSNRIKSIIGIAASFLILAGYLTYFQPRNITGSEDTIYAGKYTVLDEESDTQEAYEITRQALAMLSHTLNKSQNDLSKNLAPVSKMDIIKQ